MLKVEGLVTHYGRIAALHGITFEVPPESIVALVGANGAGKTTTLKSISGIQRATAGTVTYDGKPLHRLSPAAIVRSGVVLVPEGRDLFREMSVRENVLIGAYTRSDREQVKADEAWCYDRFPILKERLQQRAGSLSGGEQQMLAVARALMARPRLLMLDEPSLGLAPRITEQLFEIIVQIAKERRTAVLVVEQNVSLALSVSSYAYVLEHGEIAIGGQARELLQSETVREHYLGRTVMARTADAARISTGG